MAERTPRCFWERQICHMDKQWPSGHIRYGYRPCPEVSRALMWANYSHNVLGDGWQVRIQYRTDDFPDPDPALFAEGSRSDFMGKTNHDYWCDDEAECLQRAFAVAKLLGEPVANWRGVDATTDSKLGQWRPIVSEECATT